jgi:hypothetical protein
MSITQALQKQRQEDPKFQASLDHTKFQASLDYIVRPCLNKHSEKKTVRAEIKHCGMTITSY